MSEPQIPRWLFDNTSSLNEIFVVHTHSPRFIARLRYDEDCDDVLPPFVGTDSGWLAVPAQWIDAYDRTTWNSQEMEDSLNVAWKQFDRDNH